MKHSSTPKFIILLAASVLQISASGQTNTTQISDFTLAPQMQATAKELLGATLPNKILAGFLSVETSDRKGNFGRKIETRYNFELVNLESGLTGAQSTAAQTDGKAIGRGSSLWLCGLVLLLTEAQSTNTIDATTALPVGRLFVPFGMKSSTEFSSRYLVTSLTSSASSLCNPAPGTELSARIEADRTIRTQGLFSKTNSFKLVQEIRCTVGTEPKAGKLLHESVLGDYLEVECKISMPDSKTGTAKYAFLIESRYYLPIEETNEWQSSITKYTGFRYSAAN